MLNEMMHRFSEEENDPITLLMLGGMLREDMPWLAEVFVETYREIRLGKPDISAKAAKRLRRVVQRMRKSHFMEEFMMDGSKETHIMMMELPMMLDETLHLYLNHNRPPELEDDIGDDS